MRELNVKEEADDSWESEEEEKWSKDDAFDQWDKVLRDVPDDYTFVIKADKMGYPRGS